MDPLSGLGVLALGEGGGGFSGKSPRASGLEVGSRRAKPAWVRTRRDWSMPPGLSVAHDGRTGTGVGRAGHWAALLIAPQWERLFLTCHHLSLPHRLRKRREEAEGARGSRGRLLGAPGLTGMTPPVRCPAQPTLHSPPHCPGPVFVATRPQANQQTPGRHSCISPCHLWPRL